MKSLEYTNSVNSNLSIAHRNNLTKRALDLFIVAIASISSVPILMVSALLIKIKSPGPAFFAHERVGYQGKTIHVWKLRTMHINAQELLEKHLEQSPEAQAEWNTYFKLKNDPRIISGIGHFLRKSSLDELPQLWNILKGEMSVVGPRPVTYKELDFYGDSVKYYLDLYPGLTGLWQVSGRNNKTYEERVKLDVEYHYNCSLIFDLKIFLKTFYVVLLKHGSY